MMTPAIVERAAQVYVGRRESITMAEFGRLADQMPEMFGELAAQGVAAAGAPFFRYVAIDMSAEMVVEVGIPVAEAVPVAAPGFVETLPAGRYASVVHVGHPDELMGVTAQLLDWGQREGLAWDMTPTPDGEVWAARLEVLLTNPAEQPDMHKWETALLFKLA